jgi:hypothetical protein
MKLIIAGGRNLVQRPEDIGEEIDWLGIGLPTEVVSGGANGIDKCGEVWAKRNKIPVKVFEADWRLLGKAAGPIRNHAMAEYADALLLIWNGVSAGSRNMKKNMEALGKPVFEFIVK